MRGTNQTNQEEPTMIELAGTTKMKRCNRCCLTQDIGNFGHHARTKDGYQPWCRECCSVVSKEAASLRVLLNPPSLKKKCFRCKRTKTVKSFSPHRSTKDGLQPYCRRCVAEYGREYRAAERAKARSRARDAARREARQAERGVVATRRSPLPTWPTAVGLAAVASVLLMVGLELVV